MIRVYPYKGWCIPNGEGFPVEVTVISPWGVSLNHERTECDMIIEKGHVHPTPEQAAKARILELDEVIEALGKSMARYQASRAALLGHQPGTPVAERPVVRMDYALVYGSKGDRDEGLGEQVACLSARGWKPQGGVAFNHIGRACQAMVRSPEDVPEDERIAQ